MGDPGPIEGVINGKEDAYKADRQRYKEGSDVIKITIIITKVQINLVPFSSPVI